MTNVMMFTIVCSIGFWATNSDFFQVLKLQDIIKTFLKKTMKIKLFLKNWVGPIFNGRAGTPTICFLIWPFKILIIA